MRRDAAMLAAAGAQGSLKHAQYFASGYLGGELLILSRWPIQYIRCPPSLFAQAGKLAWTACNTLSCLASK